MVISAAAIAMTTGFALLWKNFVMLFSLSVLIESLYPYGLTRPQTGLSAMNTTDGSDSVGHDITYPLSPLNPILARAVHG
jgi:hypothetical protein